MQYFLLLSSRANVFCTAWLVNCPTIQQKPHQTTWRPWWCPLNRQTFGRHEKLGTAESDRKIPALCHPDLCFLKERRHDGTRLVTSDAHWEEDLYVDPSRKNLSTNASRLLCAALASGDTTGRKRRSARSQLRMRPQNRESTMVFIQNTTILAQTINNW